ncbi:HYC_CC_PP family protein [Confluentibacter flavum]|uniref:Secreted protein n=1 Tax=Confluentibacter flavum TaxID=1909700 RepID=A0A2N3HKF7_9FLAO|nr:hypothetical protein [Confluentibacter flavum]PKQ45460.1 hypothetical protein CSW08_07820 [Confluentibacter flavum]
MKQIFHKIVSMLMAFVVLFSTLSFTLNMHYCGDTLVETAFLHKAKGCGMELQNPSTEGCVITKLNCCNDKQLLIDGQDELQLKIDKISLEKQVFITSFVHTYINLFEGLDNNAPTFKEYKPPLVTKQLYKIDETYLI